MYVSIIRPLGYEPNALPLRQFAARPPLQKHHRAHATNKQTNKRAPCKTKQQNHVEDPGIDPGSQPCEGCMLPCTTIPRAHTSHHTTPPSHTQWAQTTTVQVFKKDWRIRVSIPVLNLAKVVCYHVQQSPECILRDSNPNLHLGRV